MLADPQERFDGLKNNPRSFRMWTDVLLQLSCCWSSKYALWSSTSTQLALRRPEHPSLKRTCSLTNFLWVHVCLISPGFTFAFKQAIWPSFLRRVHYLIWDVGRRSYSTNVDVLFLASTLQSSITFSSCVVTPWYGSIPYAWMWLKISNLGTGKFFLYFRFCQLKSMTAVVSLFDYHMTFRIDKDELLSSFASLQQDRIIVDAASHMNEQTLIQKKSWWLFPSSTGVLLTQVNMFKMILHNSTG